ncbi:helix-turn-helix domain-containing protein [uncultured Sphingobacterium sp.]|uniref:helix-turn-helix domain-containing protein n=1 Tax=uncultured Sphingobacterium sp. TaxID=182688 RepID=UPI003749E575
MNLGKTIKYLRIQKEYNQEDLASKCGITQATLSLIENNKKRPSKSTIDKLCKTFEISEIALYVLAAEKEDVPEDKREAFEAIFPQLKELMKKVFTK